MTSSPPRRRRGRQPRPSLLSSRVKAAVAAFALQVGQPRVIEPAGFRDFRGWLSFIGSPSATAAWAPLIDAVLRDTASDLRRIDAIKHDLVREIVKAVVIPRENESSKLVSTNCGRQCARPVNGVTLMTILDKMFDNVRQWKEIIPAVANGQSPHPQMHYPRSAHGAAAAASPSTDHYSASSAAQPKPVYPPSSDVTQYTTDAYGGGASTHTSNHSSSSLPRSQPTQHACYQRWDTLTHEHTNSRSLTQGSQEGRGRSSRPLPSFQELEDSLHSPSYHAKRAKR